MKANIVDLRYKMKDVLKALTRKERVEIIYRGKSKGIIIPTHELQNRSVKDHPFFGLSAQDHKPMAKVMEDLRGGRYRAL
jgi:hypothetical protein